MGNHDLLSGNHSILLVLGWNPDFHRAPADLATSK
jgi:hypothetical protein